MSVLKAYRSGMMADRARRAREAKRWGKIGNLTWGSWCHNKVDADALAASMGPDWVNPITIKHVL